LENHQIINIEEELKPTLSPNSEVTLSVCVWRWSNNSLSGSRWFDRWAKKCLEAESRDYLGFWKHFFFVLRFWC